MSELALFAGALGVAIMAGVCAASPDPLNVGLATATVFFFILNLTFYLLGQRK